MTDQDRRRQNILKAKALPGMVGQVVTRVFGDGTFAVLNFAVAAVATIAIVGSISVYFESYLTSVSQWVGHDLRRTVYHHIQRLSTLFALATNFAHLDRDHTRGFGIMTTHAVWVRETLRLCRADCSRAKYVPKTDTFVVSPANARKSLGAFLHRGTKQLLIYDPQISDKEMINVLDERKKAGVAVRIIGKVLGRGAGAFDAQSLDGRRLHTRTIIRDGHQAFIGSQSLRTGRARHAS